MTLNIVFLVDTSASMAGRKIEQLNEFMAEAVVLAERIAFDKGINIPIRVIEFNSEAKWLFGDADKGSGHIDWIPLHVDKNGHTDIVKAIHTAISIMHKRILGERDYRHVVVLVSDGLGDDRQKSIEAIENLKHSLKEKITRIAVRVEGANEEELITFASMVFNDCYGVKLRVHAPKDSSRVRCLANERCVREDFSVAKYPRSCFNGVLLSSDGMYESMDKGNHYYDYCIQLKNRFLERSPHEPYQAFCYKEEGEPYKDFSRMRTQDDCSIAMAIEQRDVVSDYETIMTSLLSHSQAAIFKRWSPECMSFFTKNDTTYSDVIVSRMGDDDALLNLNSAVLDAPDRTWNEGELCFNEYPDTAIPTLEFMRCSGMLRRDKSNPSESEQLILNVYLSIVRLRKELSELGLAFNASALFNVAFDGRQLHIRKEAVRRITSSTSNGNFDDVEMCFSHLLGIIESEDKKDPVFDIGYIDRGIKHYRIGHPSDELTQLQRINKKLYMRNISSYSWKFDDETVLPPGESRELGKNMEFTLLDGEGEELETYKYVSKELL